MAESPALKRKREGATPLRKKVKTQVKPNGVSQDEARTEHVSATPKTPAPVVNGVKEESATPSLSKSAKKKLKKQEAGKNAATPLTNGLNATPASSGKKAKDTPDSAAKTMADAKSEAPAEEEEPAAESTAVVKSDIQKVDGNKQKKAKSKSKKKGSSPWTWSPPLGGWFLAKDPVFTSDEKHLIVANYRALQVYATDSSTLVSTLSKRSSYISAYALSATNPNHVYTASAQGLITLWDWVDAKTLGRWDIGTNVQSIAVVADPATNLDLVYSLEIGSSNVINVHALRTREQGAKTELKQILKQKSLISGMRVYLNGKIVIVATSHSVLVGRRSKSHNTALQDYNFVWREFQTAKRVTTFDAYIRDPEIPADTKDHIDLAIGDAEGSIWLFEDVLASFAKLDKARKGERAATDLEMLRPKRFHWHREAVASVKWSRDGHYLISGGAETVLVLWQLSTGKMQHLPHLTAAIENIVVSPSGASYSITLANNSVVVLSTTELEPKTNVIGIQSRRVDAEHFPKEANPSSYSSNLFSTVPMVADPKHPSQVLFTVPSSQPRPDHTTFRPQPYLQAFDVATQHSTARQALTRNNATDPNMAPDGNKIEEPNVKLMQISHDGKWLATVDEWIPPSTDMGYLDEGIPEFNEEERVFRRETYLKFWSWDEKSAQWMLETRIDTPHLLENVGASARILDLVVDPAAAGFATVGEDRSVKIWRPKTRTRDGVTVRGDKSGAGLVSWSLARAVDLNCNYDILGLTQSDLVSQAPKHACLGFSQDGSVLAAGISDAESGVIHMIDAITGTIRRSITELDVTGLSSIGILGRHMVVVTRSIYVWDLVADKLVYCVPEAANTNLFDSAPQARLAVNATSETFAVALPHFEVTDPTKNRMKGLSTVAVFDPYHSQAVWQSTTQNYILALVPNKSGKGFIVLDSDSCIRTLSPDPKPLQLPTPSPESLPAVIRANAEDESEAEEEENKMEITADHEFLDEENDKPVVRSNDLVKVFDVGSQALPPVKDLFNAVVGLYARKPRVAGSA